jgi:hypothetical protein
VVALRNIRKGEEILNYYGPHPNSELLRRYGYTTAKHSRYDVVDLDWELVVDSIKKTLPVPEATWAIVVCHTPFTVDGYL